MSLMDVAQLLGNLGEFIGAIVIIATLIYLAMQVKQNTNALHAQSRQSVLAGSQAELLVLMEHPDIVTSIVKKEPLTKEEHVKLHGWMLAAMRLREFSWLQYQSKVIDEVQWRTEVNVIKALLRSDRTRTWWELLGRNVFGAAFGAFVDELLKDQPTTNEIFDLATDWTIR